jgi:hypothetical protein
MTELRKARKVERQSDQRTFFPVRLVDMETLRDWECFDADSGKDRSPTRQPPYSRPLTCRHLSRAPPPRPSATSAVELREYFIPDFSHWKEHDSFETAFARLLKALRSEEPAK